MNEIPPLATDCHMHVFGDPSRYPPSPNRTYTPVEATLAQWRAISQPFGFQRVVLVQPSAYGTDNTRMLEGLREAGEAARGIAVIDSATPDDELHAMHAFGVRGVRLNLTTGVSTDPAEIPAMLRSVAARIAPLGWHMQVLIKGAWLDGFADLVSGLGVPVVFDHMAGMRAALGLDQPGLQAGLRLLREGACWMKISGADHVASRRDSPEEALPIMHAMVEANPDRLVWGSDWPHVGPRNNKGGPQKADYLPIDHGRLLALLRRTAGDSFSHILAENPAKLYGWR